MDEDEIRSAIEPLDLFEQATVLQDAVAASGLPADLFALSPLTALAVPAYTNARMRAGRVWSDVHPGALRNPVFWLPAKTAGRFSAPGSDGGTQAEPDEIYAVRIALTMEQAGLWTDEDGWVDCLEWAGVPDTAAGMARVAAWQAGGPDEALTMLAEAVAKATSAVDDDKMLQEAGLAWELMSPLAAQLTASELARTLRADSDQLPFVVEAVKSEFAIVAPEELEFWVGRQLDAHEALTRLDWLVDYYEDYREAIGSLTT